MITDTKQTTDEAKLVSQQSGISSKLVWLLAIASGLAVANLYYVQPVLAEMGRNFGVSSGQIGFISVLGQIGYALGLLFIVPLGDAHDRRNLITIMLLLVSVALVAVAISPSLVWLGVANLAVGITTIVPQIIVPFAASLAHSHERGKVVGTVMSGLLIGILLARTISGFIGANFGWRTIYWIAAALMVSLAVVMFKVLPKDLPHNGIRYSELLKSLWKLVKTEQVLREVSILGGFAFGAFNAFWVTLAFFLQTPPYHFGSDVAGLFGLVGVAGALGASFAGKLSDRMDARVITGIALAVSLVSYLTFWIFGQMLFGLVVGVILLDLGTQVTQITNQTRVYSLHPESRSRLNTIYMVSYFIGGSLGSGLGVVGWGIGKWSGVCLVGVILLLLALVVYFTFRRQLTQRPVKL